MNPWLVVPTLGNRRSLVPLLRNAEMPAVVVWTHPRIDPGPGMTELFRSVGATLLIDRGSINIHRWWSRGIDVTLSSNAGPIVLCNDDVRAAPGELRRLTEACTGDVILSYLDRPEHAATRVTPITGWCFAIDPWRLPIVDGECDPARRPDRCGRADLRGNCGHLQWWYGDHDIELRALTGGPIDTPQRIAKVKDLDIEHLRTDWRYDRQDEIAPLIARDKAIFYQRWSWKVGDPK